MQQLPTQFEPAQENIPVKRSRSCLVLSFLVILSVLAAIYVFPYILTPIIKNKIHIYLQKTLKTEITLGKVGLNIFTGSVILNDSAIKPKQESLFEVKQAALKYDIPSLLKRRFIISKIVLNKPIFRLCKSVNNETNWDFLWRKEEMKTEKTASLPPNEILIKDGKFIYTQELKSKNTATAEFDGIFIYIKNYKSPISYIQDIPLYTRIKGRGCIPTGPSGVIAFSANANLIERQKSFQSNVSMDNISLTYFNNFYPEDSQIQVVSGNFSLLSHVQCIHEQLQAKPNATVKNLQLKLTKEYETGDTFQLPVLLVVDFFDLYKDELKVTFEVSGTLSDPEFQLEQVVAQNVSKVVGESIIRTIAKSPALLVQLGDKLIAVADRLKEFGIDIGKNAVDAIKQLEKPAEEFIKGLKGE